MRFLVDNALSPVLATLLSRPVTTHCADAQLCLRIVNGFGRGFDVNPGVARCIELAQLPAQPQVETESLSSECASQLMCCGLNDGCRVRGWCIWPEDTREVTSTT